MEDKENSTFYMAGGGAEILCTILKVYQKFKLLQPIKGVLIQTL